MIRFFCYLMLIMLANSYHAFAKNTPIVFGQISDDEINMSTYTTDTNASAVILCDYGVSEFDMDSRGRFEYVFQRNLRIKILKKEGYRWARQTFFLLKNVDINNIKAFTYNMVDGKLEKTKLEKDQLYKDKYNFYLDIYKFEMPAVKEGSILDIQYEIRYYSLGIQNWNFQSEIPTIHSEYRVSVPEYFVYKQLERGYFPIGNKTEKKRTAHDKLIQSTFDYEVTDYVFTSDTVPAFKEEKYLTSKKNYISSIQFEIAKAFPPNSRIQDFTNSWESIGKDLMFDSDFGGRTRGISPIRNQIHYLDSLEISPDDKLTYIYEYIQKEMNWTGSQGIHSWTPGKAWNDKKGSCGDINLMLVQALKKLGFDAYPVILSTRDNGFIHPAQMMLEQFNYVIAAVKNDNGSITLLDATDKNLPPGVLPEPCLNKQGRLITKKGGEWIDLSPQMHHKTTIKAQLKINKNNEITGIISENYSGYAAIEKRDSLDFYSNSNKYMDTYKKSFPKFTLSDDSIIDQKTLTKPLIINYAIESSNWVENSGELFYFNPMILGRINENPFKLEKRYYPVDYSFLNNYTYITTIEIPEGFQIESMPENTRMVLPGRQASFIQSVSQTENLITIMSKFDINIITFLPDFYKDLQMFYNQVISIQNKQVILKKS